MTPSVSFILVTRNRREVLLRTLDRVESCGLPPGAFEILVVDNASDDGTSDVVMDMFPEVRLIRQEKNLGACARNAALPVSSGRYIVFLDDDSYPLPGSIARMIRHFQHDPRLGAASCDVRLPDGRSECSAYPDVFIGCGVGLRRTAIDEVGGLPDDFFMQAEEYDLSLRLLDAGWRVRRFDDLHVVHEKSSAGRCSWDKMRLDVRNNLLLAMRRFPRQWVEPFVHDWMARYWAIARASGRRGAACVGFVQGAARGLWRRGFVPVADSTFEQFARIEETRHRLAALRQEHGIGRALLIDWGKNMIAYRLACEAAGIRIVAVADRALAGTRYGDFPVVSDDEAVGMSFDAAIVSNLSPVHATDRLRDWRARTSRPVLDVFEADCQSEMPAIAA
jgi:GT2 family glycosyltransferase